MCGLSGAVEVNIMLIIVLQEARELFLHPEVHGADELEVRNQYTPEYSVS